MTNPDECRKAFDIIYDGIKHGDADHQKWLADNLKPLVEKAFKASRADLLDEVEPILEHIRTLRKRADDSKGFVDLPYKKALNVACAKANQALDIIAKYKGK